MNELSRRTTLKGTIAAFASMPAIAPFAATATVSDTASHILLVDLDVAPKKLSSNIGPAQKFKFRSDPTIVWYEQVLPKIISGANELSGLTMKSTMFQIQQLALDHGFYYVEEIDLATPRDPALDVCLWTISSRDFMENLPHKRNV